MSGNQPEFDPLHCTTAEEDDMVAGYLDGFKDRPPLLDSLAYAWGRRNGVNDRLGIADEEQALTAARIVRGGRKRGV